MSIVVALYPSANVPTTTGVTSGGAINTSAVINPTTPNAFIPELPIPASPDPDLAYHYKCFGRQEGTSDLDSWRWWILNGLAKPVAASNFQVVADAPCTNLVRCHFLLDSSGEWDFEDITLNGTTPVNALKTHADDTPIIMQCINEDASSLEVATANIFLQSGGTLGFIPLGRECAASNYRIGLDASLNASTSTSSRVTTPAGITYAEAYLGDDAVTISGDPSATTNDAIGIWIETTLYQDMPAITQFLRPVLAWKGTETV